MFDFGVDKMEVINKPIEVITWFNTMGDIVPLKIRLQDTDYTMITAKIGEILYTNVNKFAGEKTIDFGCKLVMGDSERLLEIRYYVANHKWLLRRRIY